MTSNFSYNRDRHKGRKDANPLFVLLEDALGALFRHGGRFEAFRKRERKRQERSFFRELQSMVSWTSKIKNESSFLSPSL